MRVKASPTLKEQVGRQAGSIGRHNQRKPEKNVCIGNCSVGGESGYTETLAVYARSCVASR